MKRMGNWKWWVGGLAFCLLLVTLSPLASSAPDGLEKTLEEIEVAGTDGIFSVMSDYLFPGIQNEALATILAGWIGTIIVFAMAFGLMWLVSSRRVDKGTKDLRVG